MIKSSHARGAAVVFDLDGGPVDATDSALAAHADTIRARPWPESD